jgi:pimeloyl-ACP methyl ester carboxylesterase
MSHNLSRRSLFGAAAASAAALSAPVTAATKANPRRRTYVLVHGAWFGAWVWNEVAELLRAEGHRVYTPSMTGLGDRRHLRRRGINLDTHADDIINLMVDEDLRDVVLVGWSYGGMVISDVVARAADRIASMVYLDAFYPARGRSQASYVNPGDAYRQLVEQAADNQDIPPFDLNILIISPAMRERARTRISLQPIMTFLQASKAPAQRPAMPHSYILAGKFKGGIFESFHQQFVREKIGDAYVLDTSHSTMLDDPKGTAALLLKVR